jgi:hypothetical protein
MATVLESDQYRPEVRSVVAALMVEFLRAANSEAECYMERYADMQGAWAALPDNAAALAFAVSLREGGVDGDAAVVNAAIRQMVEQCKARATVDWEAFEENTLMLAGAEVDKKVLEVSQLAQVKAAERAHSAVALKARKLQAPAPSASLLAARARLRQVQLQVSSAREALMVKTDKCRVLQDQLGDLQEARKNRLVARVEARELGEKNSAEGEERRRVETAKAQVGGAVCVCVLCLTCRSVGLYSGGLTPPPCVAGGLTIAC